MLKYKKIKAGKKSVDAVLVKLQKKNLILLRGRKGYVMCGYLDMAAAEKFGDAAARITGVSTIAQVLKAKVQSCSSAAKELGIYEGQPVRDALEIIA